jgi:hypothetical protein
LRQFARAFLTTHEDGASNSVESEFRAKAEKKLGDKFDIRQFPQPTVGCRFVTIGFTGVKINRWIEESKQNS